MQPVKNMEWAAVRDARRYMREFDRHQASGALRGLRVRVVRRGRALVELDGAGSTRWVLAA